MGRRGREGPKVLRVKNDPIWSIQSISILTWAYQISRSQRRPSCPDRPSVPRPAAPDTALSPKTPSLLLPLLLLRSTSISTILLLLLMGPIPVNLLHRGFSLHTFNMALKDGGDEWVVSPGGFLLCEEIG